MPGLLRSLLFCLIGMPVLSTRGQSAGEHATYLGFTAGGGPTFTATSPRYLDLGGTYLAATAQRPGSTVALSTLVRVQRGPWFVQPELRYQNVYSAGYTYPSSGGGGYGSLFHGADPRLKVHMRQLAVGLVAGYRFGPRQAFYGLLGPALAFRMSADGESVPYAGASPSDQLPYALDQAPVSRQGQLHGGVGWWGRHWGVEARGVYGLSPLARRLPFAGQDYAFQVRSTMLLLSVGYHFDVRGEEE